jgi:hypothetical protein
MSPKYERHPPPSDEPPVVPLPAQLGPVSPFLGLFALTVPMAGLLILWSLGVFLLG